MTAVSLLNFKGVMLMNIEYIFVILILVALDQVIRSIKK